jgi:replicative DNA helicase
MSNKTYYTVGSFDDSFQVKIVALILNDPTFLPRYANTIDWRYFDSEACALIVRLVKDYYDSGSSNYRVPIREVVKSMVVNETRGKNDEFQQVCLRLLADVYDMDMSYIDQIADKVVEFGRSRTMEAMVTQAADYLEQDKPVDNIWELFDRGRQTTSFSADELNIKDQLMSIEDLIDEDDLYNPEKKIPTRILSLDGFMGGGLARREVGVVLGYTGTGKSTFLINMGAAAFLHGHTVVHFTVNELETVDLAVRYAARLSGLPTAMISSRSVGSAYKEKMQEVLAGVGDADLVSQYVSPGTSVSALRSFLSRQMYKKGKAPSLVCIDNADDLSSAKRDGESYVEKGLVYTELKALAHDFGVAVWTDTQTNRSAAKGDHVGLDMISESHKKACKADVVVAISQTMEEYTDGICRLKLVKCRRTGKGGEIKCSMQSARMLIQEHAGGISPVSLAQAAS